MAGSRDRLRRRYDRLVVPGEQPATPPRPAAAAPASPSKRLPNMATVQTVAHAHRHLERQFGQSAHRHRAHLAGRAQARHRLPAGNQERRRRRFRASSSRRSATTSPSHGQKSFNGVAILSKLPFDEVNRGLPGDDDDDQARFIEGVFSTDERRAARRLASTCPTAIRRTPSKFAYKLAWMDRLIAYARERLELEEPLVLAGDYNVIPTRPTPRSRRPGPATRCSCRRRATRSAR